MSDSDSVLKMRLVEFADTWDVSLLCVMFEVRGGLPERVGRWIYGGQTQERGRGGDRTWEPVSIQEGRSTWGLLASSTPSD